MRLPSLVLASACLTLVIIACQKKDPPEVYVPGGSGGSPSTSGGMGGGEGGNESGGMGGRIDNAFCEEAGDVSFGGMGGSTIECSSSDGVTVSSTDPVDLSLLALRYNLTEDTKFHLQFSRPVCGADDNTVLIKRQGTGTDVGVRAVFLEDGLYQADISASDWAPYDLFDLAVRRGVTDVTCGDPLAQEFGVKVVACSANGWPTAGWPSEPKCTAAPAALGSLNTTFCSSETSALPLAFTCGKAVGEGTLTGRTPASNPSDPELSELFAHTYALVAPLAGSYEITLDGTSNREHTVGAPSTQTAEQACMTVACEDLESVVQLDIGSTCGENDIDGLADYTGGCLIETTLELQAGETRFLTIRPDADGGCGPGKDESCDYDYTLWVKGPNAD